MERKNIIVIGAGSAGMSCALELKKQNADFLVITDVLGGRICYSEKEKVNYGAYFVMQNYLNAKKLVVKETWINPFSVLFNNSDKDYFATISLRTLSMFFQLAKFVAIMLVFMKHYRKYKTNCLTMSQREAMDADPYIKQLYHTTASELSRKNKIEKIASQMISKFSYACTGVSMDKLTALDFMNVSQGLVIPIRRFRFDLKAMEEKLRGNLQYDTVAEITKQKNKYGVRTEGGKKYEAEYVVIATPAVVTQKLLKLNTPLRQTCKLYTFHVNAKMKKKFSRYQMNVFPFESEIIFTAIQDDGTYLIYTREKDADLKKVCESYSMINMKAWEKAMYVYGDAYVEQEYGENLYVAGDHNGLGLEPTAISGIYAANRILTSLK